MAEAAEPKKRKVRQRRPRGQLHLDQETSGIWYIRGSVRGQRVRESTGTSDFAAADAIRVKREAELLEELIHGKKVVSTFAECVEHYLRVRDGGSNRRFLPKLVREFGETKVKDLNTTVVHAYVERTLKHCAGTTKNNRVVNPIITVLRCAAQADLCDVPMIQRYEEKYKKVRGVGDNWVSEFLQRCDRPKIKAYVALITTTGCRGIDAVRLRSEHINWDDGTAFLPETKNGDSRTLLVAPIMDLLRSFEHARDGTVFGFARPSVANAAISRICERIGMPAASSHRVGRHTFAERLLNKGYTLRQVAEMGGWDDVETLAKRYGHLEKSKVQEDTRNEAAAVMRSALRVVNGGKG
jgi:integrase